MFVGTNGRLTLTTYCTVYSRFFSFSGISCVKCEIKREILNGFSGYPTL